MVHYAMYMVSCMCHCFAEFMFDSIGSCCVTVMCIYTRSVNCKVSFGPLLLVVMVIAFAMPPRDYVLMSARLHITIVCFTSFHSHAV